MPPDPMLAPISCPKCDQPMRHVHAEDVTVDQCPRCGGFWLDALELESVVTARAAGKLDTLRPASANRTASAKTLLCPRDKSHLITMNALNQPQVRYESCKICGGMFLDAGELADLGQLSVVERLRKMFSF